MKLLNLFIVILTVTFISCGDNSDYIDYNDYENYPEEPTGTEELSEAPIDTANVLIGKWDYIETVTSMGGSSSKNKVFESWTIDFKDDGTFTEMSNLKGMDPDVLEGNYSINGETIIREGALEVKILELSNTQMSIGYTNNIKMVFNKL